MLELRTLGTVDLRLGGASVLSVLSQPARTAILVYLAVERPRGPHRRDVLLNLLWGERDEDAARAALRQTLYRLRQTLGQDLIEGTGEQSVTLTPGALWCDAIEFEKALDELRPADAVELYHGPFLKGFNLSDALEFERWVDAERRRLAKRAEGALVCLSDAAEARGAFGEAALFMRRALEIEPDAERNWRRLIDLLDRQGDRAGALRSYEQLVGRMASELEAAPSPETQALMARIRARRFDNADAAKEAAAPPRSTLVAPTAPAADVRLPVDDLAATDTPSRPTQTGVGTRSRAIIAGALVLTASSLLGLALLTRRTPPNTLTDTLRTAAGAVDSVLGNAAPAAAVSSIAVLPFVNLSGQKEEEYFSDGLTEELLTTLSHLRPLRVVARTSAFAFKGQNRDVREIGRLLGVGTVLEGSVRRDGDRLRVTVQLIDAANGFHLWSSTYERRMKDLFEIQTDLALRIADALRAKLTPAEQARLKRPPTASLEAYTLYLKGRYFWQQRSRGGLGTAVDYFRRAIATDSGFAAAYAGLATVYGPLTLHGFMDPARTRALMREPVLRAVELDPDLPEARTALAVYYQIFEWKEHLAEREFRRAIEMDPGNPNAHFLYGFLLGNQGRWDEALAARRRTVELDPLSPLAVEGRGTALMFAGHSDAALADFRSSIELDSTLWVSHLRLAELYESRGDLGSALRANDHAVAHAGGTPRPRAARARLLALTGDTARARLLVDSLQAEAEASQILLPSISLAMYALGRPAEALEWLERAYRQRHPELQILRTQRAAARMRGDPRFAEFFRRLQPR